MLDLKSVTPANHPYSIDDGHIEIYIGVNGFLLIVVMVRWCGAHVVSIVVRNYFKQIKLTNILHPPQWALLRIHKILYKTKLLCDSFYSKAPSNCENNNAFVIWNMLINIVWQEEFHFSIVGGTCWLVVVVIIIIIFIFLSF